MQPLALVFFTTLAMSLELFDFAPAWRMVDAHSLWHAATIPITVSWYVFLCDDAIELEGSLLAANTSPAEKPNPDMLVVPSTPSYVDMARGASGRSRSPGKSPRSEEKGDRVD